MAGRRSNPRRDRDSENQPISSTQLEAISVAVAEAVSNAIQANNTPQHPVQTAAQQAGKSQR